ncbi:hypothetical protein QPK87_30355 [Kamptonema cortianum]|nr:hypothetical protein [Kamptonema cortianum]
MSLSFTLDHLAWQVAGFYPFYWRLAQSMEIGVQGVPDILPVPATVPGSVQNALLQARLIKDWTSGLNARGMEWIENRHWNFMVRIPAGTVPAGKKNILTGM